MTTTDKLISMIGFAKRSGKIVYGYDGLKKAKNVKMYAVSDTSSDNLKASMNALAAKTHTPIVRVCYLESIVGNNVKALGLTDENMARAAMEYIATAQTDKYKLS